MVGLGEAWDLAWSNVKKAQKRQKKNYDRTSKDVPLKGGDRVFLFVPAMKQGKAHKFARPYQGPYRVVELYANGADICPVDRPQQSTIRVSLNWLRKCPSEICVPGESPIPVPEDVETPTDDICEPTDHEDQGAESSSIPQEPAVAEVPICEGIPLKDPPVVDNNRTPGPTAVSAQPEPESQRSVILPKRGASQGGKWAGRL